MQIVINILKELLDSTYQAIIGALLVVVYTSFNKYFSKRPFRKIWDVILGPQKSQNNLIIVMPSITLERFGKPDQKTWESIPKNINLLTLPEAIGVAELIERLRNAYKELEIEIHSDEEFKNYDRNFISIGGPAVNMVTKNLLLTREIDKNFKIQYPAHTILDKSDNQEFSALEQSHEIVTDYGFTFVAKNPLYPTRYCVICMGVWAFGTTAAIKVLFGDHTDKSLSSQINRYLKNRKSILIITRTEIQHYFGSPPKLIKVRELFD